MNRLFKISASTLAIATAFVALSARPAAAQTAAPSSPVVEAKFEKSVDTRSAKVQDTITAKTLRTYKLPDGTDLPKGSKLMGKITEVQSKKDGNGNSSLTFRFDTAQVKGKAEVPIHGLVVAIGPSMAPKGDLGPHSVLSRSASTSNDTSDAGRGVGSTPGLDPGVGMGGKPGSKDEDDIAMGSTLEGVALGVHKDADWTTALKGFKCDVKLDGDVDIKVQLK